MYNGNKKLRNGYTTGTCAAAAAKAAVLALYSGFDHHEISVELPNGDRATLPLSRLNINNNFAEASVIKDAGDDPDVTHGLEIIARVSPLAQGQGVIISGGEGVGMVTKPGLQVPVGYHAINPVPYKMIREEVWRVLPADKGAEVVISVPGGKGVASRTMNPRLGIIGGISILGTSGIVRPMSEDAYRCSLIPQIDVALALGYKCLVLTPGRLGVNKARDLGINQDCIVETSNFIGVMLEECVKRGVKSVVLLGHMGKMVKLAGGIFQTHSRLADGRREILAAHAGMLGAGQELIKKLMESNNTEHAMEILAENNLMNVCHSITVGVEKRCYEFCNKSLEVGAAIYSLKGGLVGCGPTAIKIGGKMGWQIK